MYAQITERCNFSCPHCCWDCGPDGEDMDVDLFAKIVKLNYDDITVGGGEPTIHPRFWDILAIAIANVKYVGVVTNGSMTDTTITLAKMAKEGVLGVALSVDAYHDPVDQRVYDAFEGVPRTKFAVYEENNDRRFIRDVTGVEIKNGRCDFGVNQCACRDLFIDPSGDVYQCGCLDAPSIGSIQNGFRHPRSQCYKAELCLS